MRTFRVGGLFVSIVHFGSFGLAYLSEMGMW